MLFEIIYGLLSGNENKELILSFGNSIKTNSIAEWKFGNLSAWLNSGKVKPDVKVKIEDLLQSI
jgi:hypothetical protein